MTREGWEYVLARSTTRHAEYVGFKHNVAVAVGNRLVPAEDPPEEAVAVLREALGDESELVREHAACALGQRKRERTRMPRPTYDLSSRCRDRDQLRQHGRDPP